MRGDRAARPHRRAGLLRRRPTGTRSRALVEHVDIPVLGNGDIWEAADALRMVERDRRRRRGRRPRLPGPAVAVPRPGRGVRRRAGRDPADPRRGGRDDAPARRAARRAHGGGAGLQGVPQARLVVPQGLRAPAATLRRSLALVDHAGRARRAARRARPGPSRSRSPSWARRGAGRARPRERVVLPEGWLDDTDGTGCGTSRRTRARPPAGEPGHAPGPGGPPHERVTGNTAEVLTRIGRRSPCALTRRVVPAPITRTRVTVSNSKGSALWQIIATSGRPMPAASPRAQTLVGPLRPARPGRPLAAVDPRRRRRRPPSTGPP